MPHDHPTKVSDVGDANSITTDPKPLYPVMASMKAVIDLAYSQMPDVPQNVVFGLFMTYHNTLLAVIKKTEG